MLKFKTLIVLVLSLLYSIKQQAQTLIVEGEILAYDVNLSSEMPEALKALIGPRHLSIIEQRKSQTLLNKRFPKTTSQKRIGPLLGMTRSQHEPFNALCPYWTDAHGKVSQERCLVGCVATAIEQVLSYYRYPEMLSDTLHGWHTENYEIADLLPGTRFDWDNILPSYIDGWTDVQAQAVALPSLAAGMAVNMHYGLSSSGSSLWQAPEALMRAFGYGTARWRDRGFYTPSHWHAMLRHELALTRPIVYSAYTTTEGGHAFCIDGIDERGFYHVSWGYGGSYDGWYDLEWLHPWEPREHSPESPLRGFLSNHSALFLHPSADAVLLEPDTLQLEALGVSIDSIVFSRQPDNSGYIPADFYFHHEGSDSLLYTFEVLSNLPTDTAFFEQADYVGIASVPLLPGEHRRERIYLRFQEVGQRVLSISNDDKTLYYQQPILVEQGTSPQLTWGQVAVETDTLGQAHCSVSVANEASAGVAGKLVTFCLMPTGSDIDTRHYRVMSIPAGEEQTLCCTFTHLTPHVSYTLLVRCSWDIQTYTQFTIPEATGIEPIKATEDASPITQELPVYDLIGRRLSRHRHYVFIQGKRKIMNLQ